MKPPFVAILFCILFLSSTKIKAQPGLSSSALNNYNQTLSFISINDTIQPPQLSGGANVTWNFSSITPSGNPTTLTYVDPATTPFGADFPLSNYCASAIYPIDSSFTYAKLNASYYDVYGSRSVSDGDTSRTDYSDVLRSYTFPFNYGDSFADTYESSTVSSTISAHRTSNMDLTYFGYGTLMLPSSTYLNAILLKRNYYSDDTLVISGTPSPRIRSGVTFIFIDPVQSGNIFSITYDTTTFVSPSAIITSYTTSIRTIALNIHESVKNNSVSLYPNPAINRLLVGIEEGSKYSGYDVCDVEGRIIMENHTAQEHNFAIDLDALPSGIYMMRLYNEIESVSRKFVKF